MRRGLVLLCGVALVVVAACQQQESIWFEGDFGAAAAVAANRGTLVMLEFHTEWCTWCKRMDKDTFNTADVKRTLRELVPIRLDAEKGGEQLADRYGVDSFPTVVFTDPDGDEIDRIVGYLPPEEFIAATDRIRAGDTFVSCLTRLSEDPSDVEAIVRAVVGLLERSDPDGAIARIKAFHTSSTDHDHGLCVQLMFRARSALQTRTYARVAKLYRKGWDPGFEAPNSDGTAHLHALLATDAGTETLDALALRLRQARFADAGELLSTVSVEDVPAEELWDIGTFAFANGHYEIAAAAYGRWYDERGKDSDPDTLNIVAWQLYLSRQSLDTAVQIARRAVDGEPSAHIVDTLARLLYLTGEVNEAIDVQRRALAKASEDEAESYREVLGLMESGEDLTDRPGFEYFPGTPGPPVATSGGGTII
jgi:thioredoxin-related protein